MAADGPVVLVIGAAGGIGSALCKRLAAQGRRLVLAGRDAEKLGVLAQAVGGEVEPLDARHVEAVGSVVGRIVARHGRIDGAVNLAGSIMLKSAHATSPAEWDEVMATNPRTAFATVRAAAPAMSRTGGGSIAEPTNGAACVVELGLRKSRVRTVPRLAPRACSAAPHATAPDEARAPPLAPFVRARGSGRPSGRR